LFVIAFDFHVTERFKHFVEGREIFAIARFISCREYDVGDRPGQLDVSDALPLGIRFRGRIFVDETGLSVAGFSGIDFLFGFAVYLSICWIAVATNFSTSSTVCSRSWRT
jgi:hypothetical protein